MRKSITTLFAAATVMALAVPVLAGGFFVLLGNSETAEARSHNAFATIKAAGCHDPEKASIIATAIGVVGGRRQTVPLKLIPLSEPGLYAVARQWPTEGRWILQFIGTDDGRMTSTVVAAGPNGVERQTAKFRMGSQPKPEYVEALLTGRPSVRAAAAK